MTRRSPFSDSALDPGSQYCLLAASPSYPVTRETSLGLAHITASQVPVQIPPMAPRGLSVTAFQVQTYLPTFPAFSHSSAITSLCFSQTPTLPAPRNATTVQSPGQRRPL